MRLFAHICMLMLAVVVFGKAQDVARHLKVVPVPEEFLPVTNPEWGNDVAITNTEPLANPTGAGRSNGTAYVAVPDTSVQNDRFWSHMVNVPNSATGVCRDKTEDGTGVERLTLPFLVDEFVRREWIAVLLERRNGGYPSIRLNQYP
jgi:hypothetical protein